MKDLFYRFCFYIHIFISLVTLKLIQQPFLEPKGPKTKFPTRTDDKKSFEQEIQDRAVISCLESEDGETYALYY